MEARGHVFKYGDNVDTDVIIPARYLNSFDPQELASHAMADIDPEFVGKVQPGDMIVARKNFGCGSSREHAPLCLKTAGVSCIIAETFARIFFRNAISDFRSLSVRRRLRRSKQATRWKSILTAARFMTVRKGRSIRDSRSRNLCRRSLRQADLSTTRIRN